MYRADYQPKVQEWFHGVGTLPTSGIVMADVELAFFLMESAMGYATMTCDPHQCEVCNAFATMWWDVCNSLEGPVRIRMQRIMRDNGVPFPPAPAEEVGSAVPSAL